MKSNISNIFFHPTKIWHCLVILAVVYVFAPLIFFEYGLNKGLDKYPMPVLFFAPMIVAATLSCFIYYKKKGTMAEVILAEKKVNWQQFVSYVALFLMFAASTVLLSVGNKGDKIEESIPTWYMPIYYAFTFACALGEEVLFRGVFFDSLVKTYGRPWFIMVVMSALFGLGHADYPYHILTAFLSSMFFYLAYYKTHSLLLCITMHFSGDDFMNYVYGTFGNEHYAVGAALMLLSFVGLVLLILYDRKKKSASSEKVFAEHRLHG